MCILGYEQNSNIRKFMSKNNENKA